MRYSGEEDISVGTPIANRTRREVEGLIGFFVNTLVMRTDLSGNPGFNELIRREREAALGAYGRQEVPFEKLVEEINPERDLSRNPLFQTMMVLQNTKREELEIRGLYMREIWEETGTAKFDLKLALTETEDGIIGSLEYSRDLYEGKTIKRMARHYENVLEKVVRDAEHRIREIELMSEAEKIQIVNEWNQTDREYGKTRFVHEMIAVRAGQMAEAIAVRTDRGDLSYQLLHARSNQLTHYLRRKGVEREDLIGICTDRSPEMVIALLGVLKAGAAYLPIDGSDSEERALYMLEDAGVKVLLAHGGARRRLSDRKLRAEVIDLEDSWEEIVKESEENPDLKVEGENLAYAIYTDRKE
jgi:non-ribosomal peptide synthetase component F